MSEQPTRLERDSLGEVHIAADRLWGSQTQRSLEFFAIGDQRFPRDFLHEFVRVKQAAAIANQRLGELDDTRAQWIRDACDTVLTGAHDDAFPLSVWQTGSGTQTNMNVNEVIANLANQTQGSPLGAKSPVHPNDHVNLSQSSNDVFPTVMHITAVQRCRQQLLPALEGLLVTLAAQAQRHGLVLKTGRTHMMDATPITLGQEFGAWHHQLSQARQRIIATLPAVQTLAIGGAAVGTGLNTHPLWAATVCEAISALTGQTFTPTTDTFSQLAAHDAITALQGDLALLATVLYKIASDVRLMNSGPRCGLGEIQIPENEPGSSVMPGKVNPTQVEALTMVCIRVMGNQTAMTFANSQGQFQLNVYKPLMAVLILESLQLLADAMRSFDQHCLQGLTVNTERLSQDLERSLMLSTALNPVLGYDRAAKAARYAHLHNLTLKAAVLQLGLLDEATFDAHMNYAAMTGPRS